MVQRVLTVKMQVFWFYVWQKPYQLVMVMQAMSDDCQWSVIKFPMVRNDRGAERGPIASDMLEISHYTVTYGTL